MVTPGDDWKNVTVPEGESVAAPVAESKPATSVSSIPEAAKPTTQIFSSSHVIDIHSLENL